MVNYDKMTVVELKNTPAYTKIPSHESKSKADKARLIQLIKKYSKKSPSKKSRASPSKKSSSVKCPKGQVVNPSTGRCLKVGSPTFNRVFPSRKSPSRKSRKSPSRKSRKSPSRKSRKSPSRKSRKSPSRKSTSVKCPKGQVVNPSTGRCLKVGSPTYNRVFPSRKSSTSVRKSAVPDIFGLSSGSKTTAKKKSGTCIERSNLPLNPHQIKVAEYLLDHHGLIAVHGLGTGKTLTAVATSQCYLDKFPNSRVIVVSPAALIDNFKKGMMEYGISNPGKYEFFSYEAFLKRIKNPQLYCSENMLIIDEAHNLRTWIGMKRAQGKSIEAGKKAKQLVKCGIKAKRVLLLTATPVVNDSYDLANLVAIVKGENPMDHIQWEYMMEQPSSRKRYLNCLFSVYSKEIDSKNYPRRINKEIILPMSDEYLREYIKIEENTEDSDIDNPWIFLSGLRRSLLMLENSVKIDFVMDKIKEKVAKGKKVVVYSNFVNAGVKNISSALDKLGIEYAEFTGEVSKKKREYFVNEYNKGNIKVLILSKAGGEGINLKESNAIFILDPPWNEAALEQAIGRVIRYNSHKSLPAKDRFVEVYTLYNKKPDWYMNEHIDDVNLRQSADMMLKAMIDKKTLMGKDILDELISFSIENNNC